MSSHLPNIVSAQFKANPFPFLARLRTSEPVHRTTLPDKTPVWLLTRYEDVNALLRDERFTKNRRSALTPDQLRTLPWTPPMFRPLERNMLDLDPPDHTRLRSLVHKAFTPRLVDQMRSRGQTVADELLDAVTGVGQFDLIKDYALPLPMTIITEILGVPTSDRHKFHKWSQAIVSLSSPNLPLLMTLHVIPSIWSFIRYLRRFFKIRRRDPRDDLVSALIKAEEAGDKLSEDELLAMVFLLLIAGHETTVNLIGSGVLALLENHEQMNKLRNDPVLIKSAVEELLRYTAPVFMTTERYAREDSTIHGITIPRGEMTLGVIGSANRDETVFEEPDQLNVTREPNKHLSFGQGIHFCLGAPLARMEAQIAINTLLRRFPDLHLSVAQESLRWRPSIFLRGLETLPVTFGAVVD
ncbi:MAG TPA: cytochrome P450 [Pyrinomonadaceae bacterium]|nr:cytochrome P450 [Pyrinomonadaceae bacterium]